MRWVALALIVWPLNAQVCRVVLDGLNRNRRVMGPVHAECPPSIHTSPFGNWGVASNFGARINGHQFQGWCRESRVCDNIGFPSVCRTACTDGWYEWNSCTDIDLYRPPNCTLYNHANCQEQVSVTGVNLHGSRTVEIPVRCPVDTNSDGFADDGGCRDVGTVSAGTNYMTFYEIDPGSGDSLIQSMYFPETPLNPTCTVWGCTPMISAWLQPIAYDTPTSPAKMTAEFAMSMPSAVFRNTGGCPAAAATAAMVGGAHFRAPVAPDSIAAIFGEALGTGTAQATSVPLPATLAGTSVAITDSRGTRHNSGLFYVSPGQVNAHVPAAVAPGNASLEVTRSDRVLSRGQVVVAPVAPALFSANATGAGPASAVAVRVTSSGTQIPQNIFSCAAGECSSIALDWGAESDTVVLLLFGTGIRGRGMLSLVVRVGSVTLVPDYAGPQGQFVGLDQVNVPLPRSLRGRGELPVTVVVGGLSSNAVLVRF